MSVGPFWAGGRVGGGGRGGRGSNSSDGMDGLFFIVLVVALVIGFLTLWVAGALLWLAVLLVLCASDLCFAGGRWVWRWRSGGGGRAEILRWAGVRWLWKQRVSYWVCVWRSAWEARQAYRAGASEMQLFQDRLERMSEYAGWAGILGGFGAFVLVLGEIGARVPPVETRLVLPGWWGWLWVGVGAVLVSGVVVWAWRGFLRVPVPVPVRPATVAASAAAGGAAVRRPASAGSRASGGGRAVSRDELRLGPRRRTRART